MQLSFGPWPGRAFLALRPTAVKFEMNARKRNPVPGLSGRRTQAPVLE